MSFWDCEDRTKRRQSDTQIGLALHRVYIVPIDAAESFYPSRGDMMDGATASLTGARVQSVDRSQPPSNGKRNVVVQFIQPEAYGGTASATTFQETRGSRHVDDAPNQRSAVRIGVASDLVSIPATGDMYPDETNVLTGLRCVKVEHNPDTVYGLHYVVAHYIARKPYSTTSSNSFQEIRGSRRVSETPDHRQAVRFGVASDLLNIPSVGDLYPDDTNPILGLRCAKVEYDVDVLPNLYSVTAQYVSRRAVSSGIATTTTPVAHI